MTAAEEFWWLGPSIAFCAFAAILWFNWGQHKVRVLRLRRPFVASIAHGPDESHEYCLIAVPAHSEVLIQLRIRPIVAYRQLELVFGFTGDRLRRPVPLRVRNTFIKTGINREISPKDHPNHYVDHDDKYHINTPVERSPPTTYVVGFVIQTNEPGNFPVLLDIVTDCGEAKPRGGLGFIVVEQSASDPATTPQTHS